MIALAEDCIFLRRENGEGKPLTPEAIAIEIEADGALPFDHDFVKEAAAAVLHHFRTNTRRDSITFGEFAEALQQVLQNFSLFNKPASSTGAIAEADLLRLAAESGENFELTFFPRLRDEVRAHLKQSPQMLRFRGLRGCVMQLTGARRWNL